MDIEYHVYSLKNGEWRIGLKTSELVRSYMIPKRIRKWYDNHPYAKMIDDNTICGDYRIDQQRPYRNVRSDGYIKIISITEMERNVLLNVIKDIEKDIKYPIIAIDENGEEYEIETVKRCPKCNTENDIDNNYCIECSHSFISEVEEINVEEVIDYSNMKRCDNCGEWLDIDDNYCGECGSKLMRYIECKHCGEKNKEENNYCNYCGKIL